MGFTPRSQITRISAAYFSQERTLPMHSGDYLLPEEDPLFSSGLVPQSEAWFTLQFMLSEGGDDRLIASFPHIRGVTPPIPRRGDIVSFPNTEGTVYYEVEDILYSYRNEGHYGSDTSTYSYLVTVYIKYVHTAPSVEIP